MITNQWKSRDTIYTKMTYDFLLPIQMKILSIILIDSFLFFNIPKGAIFEEKQDILKTHVNVFPGRRIRSQVSYSKCRIQEKLLGTVIAIQERKDKFLQQTVINQDKFLQHIRNNHLRQ